MASPAGSGALAAFRRLPARAGCGESLLDYGLAGGAYGGVTGDCSHERVALKRVQGRVDERSDCRSAWDVAEQGDLAEVVTRAYASMQSLGDHFQLAVGHDVEAVSVITCTDHDVAGGD